MVTDFDKLVTKYRVELFDLPNADVWKLIPKLFKELTLFEDKDVRDYLRRIFYFNEHTKPRIFNLFPSLAAKQAFVYYAKQNYCKNEEMLWLLSEAIFKSLLLVGEVSRCFLEKHFIKANNLINNFTPQSLVDERMYSFLLFFRTREYFHGINFDSKTIAEDLKNSFISKWKGTYPSNFFDQIKPPLIRVYKPNTLLDFGKHKFSTTAEVDLQYLFWCCLNIPTFTLSYSYLCGQLKSNSLAGIHPAVDICIIKNEINRGFELDDEWGVYNGYWEPDQLYCEALGISRESDY